MASLRVEGMSISATAWVTGRSRNTIARWLDRASSAAARFSRHILRDFEVRELQADELYTFIGSKSRPTWLFATIEVTSRVWASSLVGRRSSRNTTAVLDDVILHGRLVGVPLIATDGFESYGAAIQRLIGPACIYGQVVKTRRNDRVDRVERRVKVGSATRGCCMVRPRNGSGVEVADDYTVTAEDCALPSPSILFSTVHPTIASRCCASNAFARRLPPRIRLYLRNVPSTRACCR